MLDVTQEIINNAIPRDSGHCVIADAVKQAVPTANRISVDLATIRFTDPDTERRYVYLTPATAQALLVNFDQGVHPEPLTIRLNRPAQIVSARKQRPSEAHESDEQRKAARRKHRRQEPRTVNVTQEGQPVVHGGRTPPTGALSSTRGRRRTFGLKSLRP